jgi:hypothetical protein
MRTKWFGAGAAAVALASVFIAQPGPVQAVDANSSVNYRGGSQGRVIFDGRTHAAAGLVCTACHTALFRCSAPVSSTWRITLGPEVLRLS